MNSTAVHPAIGSVAFRIVATLLFACCLAGLAAVATPDAAHAVTRAEQTAFDRSVKAIKDYKNQPTYIVVDVSDLNLTRNQMYGVYERVRWDGHYFWINPFGEKSAVIGGTKTITYHCAYSDATITSMRKKFNAKIKAALKELIEGEDKHKPLSDEALSAMLAAKGFPIARRTVAKYREQLGLPVARLRK